MNTFAVYLHVPNPDVWSKIRAEWPSRHFILDDRIAAIVPEGIALTSDISQKLGIGAATAIRGLVVEISAFNGYTRADFWEWLRKIQA